MHKSDAEKIDFILDEHEQTYESQKQSEIILTLLSIIAPFVYTMLVRYLDVPLPAEFIPVLILAGAGYLLYRYAFRYQHQVLSRQTLLQLMRLTEDSPDARLELLKRLLSGRKLTGLDEREIRSLWWKSRSDAEDTATRRHEQDAIRKFVDGDKSE